METKAKIPGPKSVDYRNYVQRNGMPFSTWSDLNLPKQEYKDVLFSRNGIGSMRINEQEVRIKINHNIMKL